MNKAPAPEAKTVKLTVLVDKKVDRLLTLTVPRKILSEVIDHRSCDVSPDTGKKKGKPHPVQITIRNPGHEENRLIRFLMGEVKFDAPERRKTCGHDAGNNQFDFCGHHVRGITEGSLAADIHTMVYQALTKKTGKRLAEEDQIMLLEEFLIDGVAELSKHMSRLIGALIRDHPTLRLEELAEIAETREELDAWFRGTFKYRAGEGRNSGNFPEGVFEALAIAMRHLGYPTRYYRVRS